MAEPFHSRIPTLSDAELKEYLAHYSRYRFEAVAAAANELRKRGYPISRDELKAIQENIGNPTNQKPHGLNGATKYFKALAILILVVGLSASAIIYLTAGPSVPNPLGYDPLDTKKYLRQLEVYGGKVNILATQFREWFGSLWQGKTLAWTIGFLTVLLAGIVWFLGARPSSDSDDY